MRRSLVVVALVVACGGLASHGASQRKGSKLGSFMRPKLDHSKGVLEGLTLENFDLVARHARALKDLTESAEWKVSPSVNYLRYSSEFQRLADELIRHARDHDIDGATLTYLQLSISCVNCHKFVRERNMISALPPVPRRAWSR